MKASSAWAARAIRSTRKRTRVTAPASNRRSMKAAAVRVLPVPVAISTRSFAPPPRHLGRERLDAVDLVAAVHDPSIDRDVGQRAPQRACGDPAFQIVLGVEGGDLTGVGVPAAIQEAHFLAVRQEDEGNVEQRCVMDALVLGGDRVDARPLRFDDRHRAPGAVAEHVVRARAVPEGVLEEDAHPVGQVPAGILEQGVDPDPRECFGGSSSHGGTRFSRRRWLRRREGRPSILPSRPQLPGRERARWVD